MSDVQRRSTDRRFAAVGGCDPARTARGAEWVGYAFLVAAWAAMALGLWSTPSPDPAFDLAETNNEFTAVVDGDGTAVYTGTVEARYRPDTKVAPAPVGPVEVTVTLADGRMTVTMSPDNPVATAGTSKLLRDTRRLGTSHQRADGSVHAGLDALECDRGTRVTAVKFEGSAAKTDAESRPVDLHHVDGELQRVVV